MGKKNIGLLVLLAVLIAGVGCTRFRGAAPSPTIGVVRVVEIITATPDYAPAWVATYPTAEPQIDEALPQAVETPKAKAPTVDVASGPFKKVQGKVEDYFSNDGWSPRNDSFDTLEDPSTKLEVPHDGSAYVAFGAGSFTHRDGTVNLVWQENNIYLVFIKGIDPAPADLNQFVVVADYVPGAATAAPILNRNVHLQWAGDQVSNGFKPQNCGLGCKKVTIVVIDLRTHQFSAWVVVDPSNPLTWVPATL